MIIKIGYYPEAEDDKDADATNPVYVKYAGSLNDADEFLGKIGRFIKTKSVLDDEMIPF